MNHRASLSMAWRNLRRGGQRITVALLCILFGVMSLTGMRILAATISDALLAPGRLQVGGDLSGRPPGGGPLNETEVALLDRMAADGAIEAYTLISSSPLVVLRTPGSGQVHYVNNSIGVQPENYPLVGELRFRSRRNVGLATLLADPGDVALTRDLADRLGVGVGDTVYLSLLNVGTPVTGRIQGVIQDTPDHGGNTLLYNRETARMLQGGTPPGSAALLTAADPAAVETRLNQEGWNVFSATTLDESQSEPANFIDLGLKGAGVLGLLVGGIGIANTMQVILARRRKEIAVFKTLGYRQRDLLRLFLTEAFILGVAGSVAGVLLGIGLSVVLVDRFGAITTLLLSWEVRPGMLAADGLVGVATTLNFALIAILRTGQVSPGALLRNEPGRSEGMSRPRLAGALGLLAIPFALTTSLIMESATYGIGVILFALAGLLVVGGLLGVALWGFTRLLPLRRWPLLDMARTSLRRRGWSLVFAMIALFVGTVALGMATVVTFGAQDALEARTPEIEGYELTLIASAGELPALVEAVRAEGLTEYTVGMEAGVQSIEAPDGTVVAASALRGRETAADVIVEGPELGTVFGVYIDGWSVMEPGTELTIRLGGGESRTVPVVGSYTLNPQYPGTGQRGGLLLTPALLEEMTEPESVRLFVEAPAGDTGALATRLGEQLPQATVLDNVAYVTRFVETYRNLYIFGVAMAGLALLAGVLLMANAVTLAMLHRRFEIGVMKAVGYTRRHVMTTIAVEYGLSALLAGVVGVAAIQVFLILLQTQNELASALLILEWQPALLIVGLAVGLTLGTVLLTAWQSTGIRPRRLLSDST